MYNFFMREDLFAKIKNFIIPFLILLQLIIIGVRKFLDKKREQRKIKIWEEYAKILGVNLEESGGERFIKLRISNHPSFMIQWQVRGGMKEGLALLIGVKNPRLDKDFSLQKKTNLFFPRAKIRATGMRTLDIEDKYELTTKSEEFKRRFLTSRVITQILPLEPDGIFFLDRKDIRFTPIPESVGFDAFMIITISIPDNFRKLTNLVELARVVTNTLDTI